MIRFLGFLFGVGFIVFLAGAAALGVVIWKTSETLPDYAQLAKYEPPVMTRIHAGDGTLLSEYARERRIFVPIEAVPEKLIHAFISAEDKTFYQHSGLDWMGIARAMLQNVQNVIEGKDRRFIGASTITQQVAKNFLLTPERNIQRKLKEALLAQRIERTFTKDQILELYLNEILFGMNMYGVAAASQGYFGKSLDQLDVAEMAYLAALPKAPNNYHPIKNRERALERRNWVLDRMLENGYINQAEHDAAVKEPLTVTLKPSGAELFAAESFSEEVRRELQQMYGEDKLYDGGLSVRTTLDPKLQVAARAALAQGLIKLDRKLGWRGAIKTIDVSGDWGATLAGMRVPTDINPWRMAVVLETNEAGATIGLQPAKLPAGQVSDKRETGTVPLNLMQWARRAGSEAGKVGPEVKAVTDVVNVGDVIYVAPSTQAGVFHLVQIPEVEGGLVAMDPHTGRVLAMVGGFSYGMSQFNRAVQALRQPGSSIKPFVYAAALDNGYTPASVVLDAPIELKLENGELWKPKNYTNKFYGPSTLRLGIEKSRNAMTVRLAHDMGVQKFCTLAESLGIYDKLPPMLAMALGAGETTLLKMTTAYSEIANGGKKIEPTLIDRIQDRYGRTIYRHDDRPCPDCNAQAWSNQAEPELADNRPQVLNNFTAYQITSMLEGVVQRGTGQALLEVGKPIAGKTGTSNEERDAWFIGFTPDMTVGVYVGYDKPRPMGRLATGGLLAAPIVADFMKVALKDEPATPFRVPPGIQLIPIDAKTGQRAAYGDPNVILEAFKPNEGPPDDTVVIGGSFNGGEAGGSGGGEGNAAVIEGGLTTGTGGLY
ncbi:MAG: penicillin-binding protein 1A [Hyphomicrobiales bacterium]